MVLHINYSIDLNDEIRYFDTMTFTLNSRDFLIITSSFLEWKFLGKAEILVVRFRTIIRYIINRLDDFSI